MLVTIDMLTMIRLTFPATAISDGSFHITTYKNDVGFKRPRDKSAKEIPVGRSIALTTGPY